MSNGWLYLVATPEPWPGHEGYAVAVPEDDDSKGMGEVHGPKPRWLETDRLPGLPAQAWVCSVGV